MIASKVQTLYSMAGPKGLYHIGKDYLAVRSLPETVDPLPKSIQIEVTSICNIRCKQCYINYLGPLRPGFMRFDAFKKIIAENFNYWHTIRLWGIGEPFMNQDIMKIVEYEKGLGNACNISTNAMLLDENKIKRLIELKLDKLNISIDGGTKETYEDIRVGASFDKLLDSMELLQKFNKNKTIRLSVTNVLMKKNMDELKELVRIINSFGIKRISIQEIQVAKEGMVISDEETLQDVTDINKRITEAREFGKTLGVNVVAPSIYQKTKRTECVWPWMQTYITYDGLVTPCCRNIYEKHYVCGDLNKEKFVDIWNNKKYQTFRKLLKENEGPALPKQCDSCTML